MQYKHTAVITKVNTNNKLLELYNIHKCYICKGQNVDKARHLGVYQVYVSCTKPHLCLLHDADVDSECHVTLSSSGWAFTWLNSLALSNRAVCFSHLLILHKLQGVHFTRDAHCLVDCNVCVWVPVCVTGTTARGRKCYETQLQKTKVHWGNQDFNAPTFISLSTFPM